MNKQLYNIKKIANEAVRTSFAELYPATTGVAIGSGIGAGVGGLTRVISNLITKKKLTDKLLSSILIGAGVGGTAGFAGGRGYDLGHVHGFSDAINLMHKYPQAQLGNALGINKF